MAKNNIFEERKNLLMRLWDFFFQGEIFKKSLNNFTGKIFAYKPNPSYLVLPSYGLLTSQKIFKKSLYKFHDFSINQIIIDPYGFRREINLLKMRTLWPKTSWFTIDKKLLDLLYLVDKLSKFPNQLIRPSHNSNKGIIIHVYYASSTSQVTLQPCHSPLLTIGIQK